MTEEKDSELLNHIMAGMSNVMKPWPRQMQSGEGWYEIFQ